MDANTPLARSHEISSKVALVFQKRMQNAQNHFRERLAGRRPRRRARRRCVFPRLVRSVGGLRLRARRDAALDPVLGHAARARQRNTSSATRGLKPVLHFDYDIVLDGRTSRGPSTTRCCDIKPPEGVIVDRDEAALSDHRSARRPRSGHRRLQGRFAGRRRAARGPSGVLRRVLPRSRAGPDAARRVRRRAAVRQESARAASRQREAGDHRQLPGRLGRDDARQLRSPTIPARSSSTARRCRTGAARGAKARATIRCAMRAACWAARGSRR